MTDIRSKRITFLAHCLLNQNAKVAGLASYPGIFSPLISVLESAGVGIIQLPCPEFECLGPLRPFGTDTVEQYDTPEYRATCAKIAKCTATQAASYINAGYEIVCIMGVEGSPSCSVLRAPHLVSENRSQLKPGMGPPETLPFAALQGRGIFIEALNDQLTASGLSIPFIGIPESQETGSLREALAHLGSLLIRPKRHSGLS